MNSVSMNNLWNYLQGLALTANNRQWLANKLINTKKENTIKTRSHKASNISIEDVQLPTDKFVGMYNFSVADENRMRQEYLDEKYNISTGKE